MLEIGKGVSFRSAQFDYLNETWYIESPRYSGYYNAFIFPKFRLQLHEHHIDSLHW